MREKRIRVSLTKEQWILIDHALTIGVVDGSLYGAAESGSAEETLVNDRVADAGERIRRALQKGNGHE